MEIQIKQKTNKFTIMLTIKQFSNLKIIKMILFWIISL
jgi:hypothetical protein